MITSMKSLKDFREEILRFKNSPNQLTRIGVELAADYAYYCEWNAELDIKKAKFFNDVKFAQEKPLSDSACENKWLLEEAGKDWVNCKYYLKGTEKLIGAIKNATILANNESRMAM